jgi:hypothetical protein
MVICWAITIARLQSLEHLQNKVVVHILGAQLNSLLIVGINFQLVVINFSFLP